MRDNMNMRDKEMTPNKDMPFMECGCQGITTHHNVHDGLEKGHPSCMTHGCCVVVKPPKLEGRTARCAYFKTCGNEKPSSVNLWFFIYKPNEQNDEYYCACRGDD